MVEIRRREMMEGQTGGMTEEWTEGEDDGKTETMED